MGKMSATAYLTPRVNIPYSPTKRSLITGQGSSRVKNEMKKGLIHASNIEISR